MADEKAIEDLRAWEEENRQLDEQHVARERAMRERDIEEKIPNVHKRFEKYATEDPQYNPTLKAALEIAKKDEFWQKPASVQAAGVVALAMAPFHLKEIDRLKEENLALKNRLSGYTKTDPGPQNIQQQQVVQPQLTDDDDTDIVGILKRTAVPIGGG
jgi:hypothetical protein